VAGPASLGEGSAKKTIDDKADKADDKGEPKKWESRFSVLNRGKVQVPVDLELRFADGSVEHLTWDGRGGAKPFELERPSQLRTVVVDPKEKVPLENEVLENSWSEDAKTGAAWRAAARASFWQQTLEQLVGL